MSEKVTPQRILVAGIPGSGKTTYCAWLEQKKGFLHLDIDELSRDNGSQFKLDLFDELKHSAKRFMLAVSGIQQPIVVDWGFPLPLLDLVKCLNASGFGIWWFDGNRPAARVSFERRGTVPVEVFDVQMKSIEEHWQGIEDLFDRRIVNTVSEGPTHATPEHIYRKMFSQQSGAIV
jgi:hypothetical protein